MQYIPNFECDKLGLFVNYSHILALTAIIPKLDEYVSNNGDYTLSENIMIDKILINLLKTKEFNLTQPITVKVLGNILKQSMECEYHSFTDGFNNITDHSADSTYLIKFIPDDVKDDDPNPINIDENFTNRFQKSFTFFNTIYNICKRFLNVYLFGKTKEDNKVILYVKRFITVYFIIYYFYEKIFEKKMSDIKIFRIDSKVKITRK